MEAEEINSRPVGAKQLTIMRKIFLIGTILLCLLHESYAQIDPSIPTPDDLLAQKEDIKIITKKKLDDGTIVIRYITKQGSTIQRRTHPSKPNVKEEWNEAEPPQKPVTSSAPEPAKIDVPATAGPPPGSSGVSPGQLPGGTPLDKPKSKSTSSVSDDVAKGAKNATSGKPQSVLDDVAEGAEEILEDILKAISNLFVIKATGTGNTIGNIANITVKNNNDFPVEIQPQTFYIPSDGKYQSYVGRIPKGITIPPKGTVDIPVDGVCTDVHTPPVPSDQNMPPVGDWIPVGRTQPPPVVTSKPPGPSEQANPPGVSDPPGENPGPGDIMLIPIVNTVPVPEFDPSDIPHIITTSGYKPVDKSDPDIIITWPGTNTPTGGTLDPVANAEIFAPVIVSVLEAIEEVVPIIQKSEAFPTPFTRDSLKEEKALIQQTFWIASAALTGKEYTKADFTKNTYDQFQQTTGKTVVSLPDEQKEQVDEGIADFWNTFQVTGVVAKVISAESPGIDVDIPESLLQAAEANTAELDKDDVADPEGAGEEEPGFNCVCPDTVKLKLKVKRGEEVVSDADIAVGDAIDLKIKVEKLRFGDKLNITASDAEINCLCASTSCDVIWYLSLHEQNNCDEIEVEPEDTRAIHIETKAKNKKDTSIFVKFIVQIYCNADGCNPCECRRSVKLTFVDSKSK